MSSNAGNSLFSISCITRKKRRALPKKRYIYKEAHSYRVTLVTPLCRLHLQDFLPDDIRVTNQRLEVTP